MTTLPEGPFFEFLLGPNNILPPLPTRLSPEELGKLKEIPHQINSVVRTFGPRASDVYNLGDRFRIYILPESDPKLPHVADDSSFPAIMQRTAREIVKNSLQPVPAPLAKAVTSQAPVDILRAMSNRNPDASIAVTYNAASGAHVIPTLDPAAFVQPAAPPVRSRTATMPITGVTYSTRGGLKVLLTNDRLEVSLPPDLEAIVAALPMSTIREGLWLSGTILQDDNNRWAASQGGRISYQEPIATQTVAG